MIGIIGAMGIEVELIKTHMQIENTIKISGVNFTLGKISGKEVVVAVCGVGKVFAAMITEAMILNFSPDIIVNTGIAGTMSKAISIGDIAIAKDTVQFDMDTSAVGEPIGLLSGINLIHIPCSKFVIDTLKLCVEEEGLNLQVGTIATSDSFLKDKIKKEEVVKIFGGIACEMEGAAIGQVCYMNEVPYGVLRAISDSVDDDNNINYWGFKESAALTASNIMLRFIEKY